MLKLNLKTIAAVIFDMDGTMIDNMAAHRAAWKEFCLRKGRNLTDAEFKQKISGFKNDEIFPKIFNTGLSAEQIAEYAAEKESLYRALYRPVLKEVPGLTALIGAIKNLNVKLAVATAAIKPNRELVLDALNLHDAFNIILGDEDINKGKPDPEIYLKTAARLNVAPESCLVFEDSPAGVASAKSAGMRVVALTTSHSPDELAAADVVVKDFSELAIS